MAKLIPLDEAADILGISSDELTDMRSRNEIHGYRDGSSWKFKETEIERVKATLGDSAGAGGDDFELALDEPAASGDSEDLLILDDDGGDDLELGEGSDIGLGSEDLTLDDPASGTSSGIGLTNEEEDDALSLVDDDELSLVDEEPASPADITLGDEPRDPEGTGSGIGGLALDDELDLGDDLAEPAMTAEFDSASPSEMTLDSGEAEIDLSAASDGDFDLGGESAEEIDLSSSGDDDMFDMTEEAAPAADDFLLTPVEGEVDDDDSGSQVIALDSDSLSSDSALFGSSAEDEDGITIASDDISDFAGIEAASTSVATEAMSGSGMAMQPAEPPYTTMQVVGLMGTAGMILLGGLMVSDLIWNMWSFNEPYAINSSIMDMILGMMGE